MSPSSILSRSLLAVALSAGLSLVASASALAQAAPQDGAQQAGQADSSQPVGDTWITTKVKAELLAAKDVSGLDIKVETTNGVVKLSGEVTSQAQADKAVSVAHAVKGVTEVDGSGLKVAAR